MKRAKQITAFLIAVLLLIPITAQAVEIAPFASTLISTYTITLSAGSSGKLTATAKITATGAADKLGFSVIKILECREGSWFTVASATEKYKTSASTYSASLSYNGVAGREYRAYAEYTAQKGTAKDTRSKTSATVKAKS